MDGVGIRSARGARVVGARTVQGIERLWPGSRTTAGPESDRRRTSGACTAAGIVAALMQTQNTLQGGSIGWLGFELNVLRRLKFGSVALPLTGEPHLGQYLKRWDAR